MNIQEVKLPSVVYNWIKDEPKKVIKHISPSMLGGCMRVHYYAIKGIEQTTPPNPGALLNFYLGKLWEAPVEEALKKSDVEFISQKKMFDVKLNLEGTLDIAIVDKETGEWEVIDIKTESVKSEMYRKREGKTFIEASHRYVIQLGTYIMMLRNQGKKCNRGRFLVITKDNGLLREYTFEYTKELEDEILDRIKRLNRYLESNTLPPCECSGWLVDYCGFGNPGTMRTNSTGKLVSSECCPDLETLEKWREKYNKGKEK